jgi:hypothetical protein
MVKSIEHRAWSMGKGGKGETRGGVSIKIVLKN